MTENRKLDASVVIPAWNGEDFLADCLRSLREHTSVDYEIIVVDNGSRDRTAQIAREWSGTRIISNVTNRGFARAVNQGIETACGEVVFLLNQDTVVISDCLGFVLQRMTSGPQVGIVGCKLLSSTGDIQHTGGRIVEPLFESEHLCEDNLRPDIDYVTGAAMAIRQSCICEVGLFDEGFFPAYSEDVDYCLRARARGWEIAYEPRATLLHYESQSQGADRDFLATLQTQRLRLMFKHRSSEWVYRHYLPAELERVGSSSTVNWLVALARACLAVSCEINTLVDWRRGFYPDHSDVGATETLLSVLFEIRRAARSQIAELSLGISLDECLDELEDLLPPADLMKESKVPVLGPLLDRITSLRRLARWSVTRQRAYDVAILESLHVVNSYFERVAQLDAVLEQDIQSYVRKSQS